MPSEYTQRQISVDLMKEEDLQEILAIERCSFPTPWTEGMFLDEMKTAHSHCLVLKIEQNEKVFVGAYIIFWLVADEAHLHNLAVGGEFRRRGLAYKLMNVMMDVAAQAGIKHLSLDVRESNAGAISLYCKCGFELKGKRPQYYTDTHESAWVMWAENRQDRK